MGWKKHKERECEQGREGELTAVGAKAFWRVIDRSSQVAQASFTRVDLKSATASPRGSFRVLSNGRKHSSSAAPPLTRPCSEERIERRDA
jgi:hypothetical protein